MFSAAYDAGLGPREFVTEMKKEGRLIMGIGHRVKSTTNPDMRVTIIKEFVKTNFPATPLLDYALEVEKVTTAKKPNLILNVDGAIAICFVDLLRSCGAFTEAVGRAVSALSCRAVQWRTRVLTGSTALLGPFGEGAGGSRVRGHWRPEWHLCARPLYGLYRALPGPEATETGSLPAPVG